ncbi:MAG: nicotinate phosphoribosyltransferase [Thermomicrobiales bacterium]
MTAHHPPLLPGPPGLALDLYHLDAAYVSWQAGENQRSTFDLYTRSAPFDGTFMLVAGLEPALDFVRNFHFAPESLDYLRQTRPYDPSFLEELADFRFTGEILAMPEGSIAFADEPLLRVTAPFREALMLESGLLHLIGVSTLIATKAARITTAARGKPVSDFSFRRAQAPLLAARSAYIGGCVSTSLVAVAARYDIPTGGTIPHALVQLFPDEAAAFRAVAESLPHYTLLLDTYDVHRAIATAIDVAQDVNNRLGHTLEAVRLDSGDLVADSIHVRAALDTAGLREVHILASGDLDEWVITDLLGTGAPIDGFGVGSRMGLGLGSLEHGVAAEALGAVYKLVWTEGEANDGARIKLAGAKTTWPGRKQIYRRGTYKEDIIQLESEPPPAGSTPLLESVIRNGNLVAPSPPLAAIRKTGIEALDAFPSQYQTLADPTPHPVTWSEQLQRLRDEATARYEPTS